MLQSWKAVCPSCKAEYTLVAREEKPIKKSTLPQMLAGVSLLGYVVFGLFSPNLASITGSSFSTAFLAVMAMVALLALAGSMLFLTTAATIGVAGLVYHLLNPTQLSMVGFVLSLLAIIGSIVAVTRQRSHMKNRARETDARSMPEYSGWADSPKDS